MFVSVPSHLGHFFVQLALLAGPTIERHHLVGSVGLGCSEGKPQALLLSAVFLEAHCRVVSQTHQAEAAQV